MSTGRSVVLVIPLLLLDLLLLVASLPMLGIPYFCLVSDGDLPLVLKLAK